MRVHRTTGQRPLDRHAEELPRLIPLPAQPYDPSPVVCRIVDAEGLVAWKNGRYSVPWRYIGHTLPVRITETELIVYSPGIDEVARHPLLGEEPAGKKSIQAGHLPRRQSQERLQGLRDRYQKLGEMATRFLDGLLASRRCGKDEAQKVLALLGTYAEADLVRALERAVCYRAFSLRAVERVLAITAKPKSLWEALADDVRQRLDPLQCDPPILPRPTAEYQSLLGPEPTDESDSKPDDEEDHEEEADHEP